jgi:tryptophanyl-tRNA synthetase
MAQRLLTGLQASGALHIGNYFGALKPIIDLFREHEGLLMIADYHALTTLKNGEELRTNTLSAAKDALAAGLDLNRAVLFKQSDVLEHTELAWTAW